MTAAALGRGLRNPFRSRVRAALVVGLLALVTGFWAVMMQAAAASRQEIAKLDARVRTLVELHLARAQDDAGGARQMGGGMRMRGAGQQAVSLAVALCVLGAAAPAQAQGQLEGTVTGAKLTACDFKPGTCEGTLTLERRAGGKPEQVTVKVPKGTPIKRGNDHLFLPGLKGQAVVITHVQDKGERVATSIEVVTARP